MKLKNDINFGDGPLISVIYPKKVPRKFLA